MPKSRGSGNPAEVRRGRSVGDPALAMRRKLSRLPRRTGLKLAGGKRLLGIWFRDEQDPKKTVQPMLAMWLDESRGAVRSFRIFDPGESGDEGRAEVLDSFLEAMISPFSSGGVELPAFLMGQSRQSGEAGIPESIIMDDPALVEAARDMLASLGLEVEVRYAEQIPVFEEAFSALSTAMGADASGPPEPFSWEIDEALLPALYREAASYWRRAPWDYLGSDLPLSVQLGDLGPEPGVQTLHTVVLGNAGEVYGLAIYYSLDAFRRAAESDVGELGQNVDVDSLLAEMRQAGLPVDDIPPEALSGLLAEISQGAGPPPGEDEARELIEDGMVVFFDPTEESDPTYMEWLADRHLKLASREAVPSFFRTRAHQDFKKLNERETRAMTLVLQALNEFFSAHRSLLEALFPPGLIVLPPVVPRRITYTAHAGEAKSKADRIPIEVAFPSEGFDTAE